jgi:gas vesicle protein
MKKGNFVLGFVLGAMAGAAAILFANEDSEYIKVAKNKADSIKTDIGKATLETKDQIREFASKTMEKMEAYKNEVEQQIDEFKDAIEDVVDNIEENIENKIEE